MHIENVDMAVPVGHPGTPAAGDLETNISPEMAALRERCVNVVQQRYKRVFTARTRMARKRQFEVELKGIIKKLASTACIGIPDRDIKASVRIRLYTDLCTVTQAFCDEIEALGQRRRRRNRWLRAAMLLTVLATGVAFGLCLLDPSAASGG